jgi:poly(3-hydroxybutyrate) depolymerase
MALACAASTADPSGAARASGLARYNANIAQTSISGISSGAFMAIQFATAWSSIIRGVGVVAGGPYWCAKANADDIFNAPALLGRIASCMNGPPGDVSALVTKADAQAASGAIDPTDNIGRQKVYLFHGYNDTVVARSVTDAAAGFYRHYFGVANAGNLYYQTAIGAGHSFVVQADDPQGCILNRTPFIDPCGYDQAGIVLRHIYGALNPSHPGAPTGSIIAFDQSEFAQYQIPGASSLAETGFVFVPKDCADGAPCRVHIALHGCLQDSGDIGNRFVETTGYNSWADANHLIVLYPQIVASEPLPFNPQACWDWWSYVDGDDRYVTKAGAQIMAIKAMLDALTTPNAPVVSPPSVSGPAPDSVTITDLSDTGADLVWKAVQGATAYRISRAGEDGVFVAIGDVAEPGFGDAGLAARSSYRWHVATLMNGVEGTPSPDVVATTRATPVCTTPGECAVAP